MHNRHFHSEAEMRKAGKDARPQTFLSSSAVRHALAFHAILGMSTPSAASLKQNFDTNTSISTYIFCIGLENLTRKNRNKLIR